LALQYHPDINKEAGAKERFLLISEAYNYLSNPPKVSLTATPTAEQKSKADAERVKRAKAAATKAARARYAEVQRKREKAQSRAYSQAITTLVGILLLAGAIYFGNRYINRWYVNQLPQETICTVVERNTRYFWVAYEVDGQEHIKKVSGFRSRFFLVAPNGMPILNDEQFVLVHRKDDPKRSYIDFDRITPQTMDVYLTAIAPQVGKQFNLKPNDTRIECISLLAFNAYGVEGLADLFFWEESFFENMNNNRVSCASMVEEPAFQTMLGQCMIDQESP
jgi:hypothetical protein